MTVRATNDKLIDGTTQAPLRSSLPQGYRSIPSTLWINDRARFSKIVRTESVPLEVGDRFLFNSVTSAARRIALIKLQGNRRASYGAFKIQGVAAHQENAAKPPLKAQTGWSVQNDHPAAPF